MELRVGNAGWHRVDGALGLPGRVYFRVQEVDGSLRMTEFYVDGRGEPVLSGALRRFPVQALEQWAASVAAGSESARLRLTYPGPDLSRLAAYFVTTFGKGARHWVADSWRAQFDGSGVPQAPMPKERRQRVSEPDAPRLEAPADGRLSDAFLSDVARAYDAAVARREPPAKTLAALTGHSPRTVHRWVYMARKRGIMPPASSKGRIV